MTTTISCGLVVPMEQNVVYACPPGAANLFTDIAATFIQSCTQAFTASVAVTLSEGNYWLSSPFIKLTSAGPVNVRITRGV